MSELRSRIEAATEDERFEILFEIYRASLPQALEEILESEDPILKLYWARFLASVGEERAVLYLVRLLEDENPVVFEVAKKAFEKNSFEAKVKKLYPLIYSHSKAAQYFSLERLSQGGVVEIIPPLLKMLGASGEELLLEILKAFRYLPDERFMVLVQKYWDDPREAVRFQSVLVLDSLYEADIYPFNKKMLALLSDDSVLVRKAMLWSFEKKPHAKVLQKALEISQGDADPSCREQAVKVLAHFPDPYVVEHLLHLAVSSAYPEVSLRAEAVLLGMPALRLQKGLKRSLKNKDEKIRRKSLLILARLQESKKDYFEYLVSALQKATREEETLSLIEALGVLNEPRAISALEKFLEGSALLAYAAVKALVGIYPQDRFPQAWLGLLRHPKLNAISKQIALKSVLRKVREENLTEELIACMKELLGDQNLNIRYLAAQIISCSDEKTIAEPLFKAILAEHDPTSFNLMREAILSLFRKHPSASVFLLKANLSDSLLVGKLLDLIRAVPLEKKDCLFLISSLTGAPLALLETPHRDQIQELLSDFVLSGRLGMEELLSSIENSSQKVRLASFVAHRLKKMSPGFALELPTELLNEWLVFPEELYRQTAVFLLGFSRDKQAVMLLTRLFADSSYAPYHEEIARNLRELAHA